LATNRNDLDVRLMFERKEKDCYVSIAKNRLMQVIINLLTNAIKFTDQGSISYGYSCLNKKMLRFYVSDTGRGISVEQQEAIFDRFVKLDSFAQGTGLGLSICRLIVTFVGGKIWIDGDYTRGARFCFTHPLKYKSTLL
jgi:signal transduction histidine kinase